MTFFTVAAALIAVLVNVCYLREMARAKSRSLAELLLLIAFDAGLVWIIATQASAPPGF
jgi:hypothetical protein